MFKKIERPSSSRLKIALERTRWENGRGRGRPLYGKPRWVEYVHDAGSVRRRDVRLRVESRPFIPPGIRFGRGPPSRNRGRSSTTGGDPPGIRTSPPPPSEGFGCSFLDSPPLQGARASQSSSTTVPVRGKECGPRTPRRRLTSRGEGGRRAIPAPTRRRSRTPNEERSTLRRLKDDRVDRAIESNRNRRPSSILDLIPTRETPVQPRENSVQLGKRISTQTKMD